MNTAYFILDDGTIFQGNAWGATGTTIADLEICTLMTGYQGALSAESSTGKILLMTAPHIGNVGINTETPTAFTAAGIIVREPARRPSNWKTTGSLETALTDNNTIGISNIDTRAVTVHLRETGRPMRAAIISGESLPAHSTYSHETASAEILDTVKDILTIAKEAN